MRHLATAVLALVGSLSLTAQEPDKALQTQLETLHAKWFKAFESADIATMNQIETKNIELVMPDGFVVRNFSPRKIGDLQAHPETHNLLSGVSVRRFGEVAILVGMLTTQTPKETSRSAETVVFVLNTGEWKIASAQWTDVAHKN